MSGKQYVCELGSQAGNTMISSCLFSPATSTCLGTGSFITLAPRFKSLAMVLVSVGRSWSAVTKKVPIFLSYV